MKLRRSKNQSRGLTLLEVVVVTFVLALIAAMLIPTLTAARIESERLSCVSNLKLIGIAPHVWQGDHDDLYPIAVSRTNGGAMEQAATGDVSAVFQVMSNQIVVSRLLICPADHDHVEANNFSAGFSAKNISYFISVDASEANPQMLLMGDDNFEINGVPVKSGILELTNSQQISWTNERHKRCGNIAITDGSVQQLSAKGLQDFCNLATNQIAIP